MYLFKSNDFNDSLNFVKSIAFEKVHVFPYSERPGTVASKIGKDLPKQLKEQRASIMIKENDKIRENYFCSLVDVYKRQLVLIFALLSQIFLNLLQKQ